MIVKIELKNKHHVLFFLKHAMIVRIILLASQTKIEWIKAPPIKIESILQEKN
jgi:hypothetical protein